MTQFEKTVVLLVGEMESAKGALPCIPHTPENLLALSKLLCALGQLRIDLEDNRKLYEQNDVR